MKSPLKILAAGMILACAGSARAVPVTVPNPSFENRSGNDFADWTETGAVYGAANAESRAPTDGNSLAGVRYGDGSGSTRPWGFNNIAQAPGETIDASRIYTLTVDVGNWWNGYNRPAAIELYAVNGGAETPIAKNVTVTGDGWRTFNVQASGAELAGLSGRQLGIRLTAVSVSDSNVAGCFDNVRLEKTEAAAGYGPAREITIGNPGFETPTVGNNSWTPTTTPWVGGWIASGPGPGGYLAIGAQDGNQAMAGDTYQVLGATYVAGARYTLSGHFWPRFGNNAPAWIGLGTWDGTQVSAHLDGTMLAGTASWQQGFFEYVASRTDDGKAIVIELGGPFWDNITLTVQLPKPAGGVTLLLR